MKRRAFFSKLFAAAGFSAVAPFLPKPIKPLDLDEIIGCLYKIKKQRELELQSQTWTVVVENPDAAVLIENYDS